MTHCDPAPPTARRPTRRPNQRELGAARWLAALLVVIVVVGAAGFAAYWFLIRADSEPEAEIVETDVVEPADEGLAGTWELTGTESFAGYRIEEDLRLQRQTVTGRTTEVQGTLEIDDSDTVTDAEITVDMTTLSTGTSQRDDAMRDRGLETNTFPQATFTLTEPISLPSTTPGETVNVEGTGELTLHGVTREVTIPLEARYDGSQIQVVGSLRVEFADYQIEEPTGPFFDIVEPAGTMEFQLFFTKG